MAGMGFSRVELSHGIRITLVPGILKALEEGVVKVTSVHNFCPLPMGVNQPAPNYYQPSSPSDKEREQWVRQTKRTLDFAAQVGAAVAVCHLGSVPYRWFRPERKIEAYLARSPDAARSGDPAYRPLLDKALAALRRKAPPYWSFTRDCILQVLDYAQDKHVTLGFENREAFTELPLDADFPSLFEGLPAGSPAGYWHDVGHGHLKESMGVTAHRALLEANAAHQVGFHLHDVSAEGHDHQAVGEGRVDFAMVGAFWKPTHHFVIELSPRVSPQGVADSRERVQAMLDARFSTP